MTMHLTHDGAPGHVADAHEHGWACSCGAGNTWEEERPRSRGAGGARRHLTAAARNNPEYQAELSAAIAEDEPAQDAPAEPEAPDEPDEPEAPAEDPAPMTYAERLRAAQEETATTAEFQTP